MSSRFGAGSVQAILNVGVDDLGVTHASSLRRALGYALREEDFGRILGAAVTLVLVGTMAYTFGAGWSLVDGFYFAVATLTTSSIADPNLTITDAWLKVFTAFYVLVGIGILVEIARRLGMGFIAARKDIAETKAAKKHAGSEAS